MNRYFVLIILFLQVHFMNAQDTIVKRNGDTLLTKLTEVNPGNIRYKRFDYQDGPVFTLPMEEIKYVVYANGVKESFENFAPPPPPAMLPVDLSIQTSGMFYYYKERRIRESDMLAIAKKLNDKKLNMAVKKTEEIRFMQNATIAGGGLLGAAGLFVYVANRPVRYRRGTPMNPSVNTARANARKNGEYMMLGALGCELVSVVFRFDKIRHAHLVVELYNKTILQ